MKKIRDTNNIHSRGETVHENYINKYYQILWQQAGDPANGSDHREWEFYNLTGAIWLWQDYAAADDCRAGESGYRRNLVG